MWLYSKASSQNTLWPAAAVSKRLEGLSSRRMKIAKSAGTRLAGLGLFGVSLAAGAHPGPYKASYDVGFVAKPRLFAEGVVSTEDDEVGGVFSPDGTEFYFSKLIPYTSFPRLGLLCVSRFKEGRWGEPLVLPFSGRYLDFLPQFSPDGRTLYFSSSRPLPGSQARGLRIFRVARTTEGWGEPEALPPPVNVDGSWNWGSSVTRDGTLYFASTREGGQSHIYRSRSVKGAYAEAEKLGPEINSAYNERDPYVSPDERILIFASAGNDLGGDQDRPETLKGSGVLYARADLYVSTGETGQWSQARHLQHGINSVADEGAPSLTPDGKYLFFTSERSPFALPASRRLRASEIERMLHSTLNGHGNIFFVSRGALDLPGERRAK
jgi:Tol biopolymer transport system component